MRQQPAQCKNGDVCGKRHTQIQAYNQIDFTFVGIGHDGISLVKGRALVGKASLCQVEGSNTKSGFWNPDFKDLVVAGTPAMYQLNHAW